MPHRPVHNLWIAVGLGLVFVVVLAVKYSPDMTDQDLSVSPDEVGARVISFCGGCHSPPDPLSLPKDSWYQAVDLGFNLYFASGRSDLVVPDFNKTVDWFRTRASDELVLSPGDNSMSTLAFRQEKLDGDHRLRAPSISYLKAIPSDSGCECYLSDMQGGGIWKLNLEKPTTPAQLVLNGSHPARILFCDLDHDQRDDIVMAELGSFLPQDHDRGAVTCHLGNGNESIRLLSDVGRVADVRAADLDGDQDLDLVVAEFGWRKKGQVHILWNVTANRRIQFLPEIIDTRHGAIHVPIVDLNRDGKPDFLVLFSQEHEEIDAYINVGFGRFERQIVFQSSNPGFGSSSLETVDLDSDGDLDVLFTNGDTLDSKLLKPHHGVRWLENQGDFPFKVHELTLLPGATSAKAGDVDGDGDLDVVASAWIPDEVTNRSATTLRGDVLIWLEQTDSGEFIRHPIKVSSRSGYIALDIADFDRDSDLDVIAGCFGAGSESRQIADMFVNQRIASSTSVVGNHP